MFPPGIWDDSSEKTASRLIRFLEEYIPDGEMPFSFTVFDSPEPQIIVIKDIEFASLCKHHMAPFFGSVHIGYLPSKRMAGASKLPRTVDYFAKRPQTQEFLTEQIAARIKSVLECQGVGVVIEAQHTCISCRGIRKVGATMQTSVMKGVFLSNSSVRQEFFNLLRMGH